VIFQIKVFWVVMKCSIVVVYMLPHLHLTLKMGAAWTSKMLVSYCRTTWHHNSEALNLKHHCYKNLKTCKSDFNQGDTLFCMCFFRLVYSKCKYKLGK